MIAGDFICLGFDGSYYCRAQWIYKVCLSAGAKVVETNLACQGKRNGFSAIIFEICEQYRVLAFNNLFTFGQRQRYPVELSVTGVSRILEGA